MSSKAERLAVQIPAHELLENCPKCGAAVGERCTVTKYGKTVPAMQSHSQRKEASKRPLPQ